MKRFLPGPLISAPVRLPGRVLSLFWILAFPGLRPAPSNAGAPTARPAAPTVETPLGERLPNPLTLDAAKRVALRGYPGLRAAAARLAAAAAAIRQARAAYFPTVRAGAEITRVQDIATGSSSADVDPFEIYSLGLSVSWTIFDGLQRRFTLLSARAAARGSAYLHQEARRLLLQGVTAAYLNALLARENMRISQEDARFNRGLMAEANKRFHAGTAARSDVLNFEIRAARAESRLLSAGEALRIARLALARLLGLGQARLPKTLHLARIPKTALLQEPNLSVDNAAAYALAHRPDLLERRTALDRFKANLERARGALRPTLVMTGAYSESRRGSAEFHDKADAASQVALQLHWDIFTGGYNRAEIRRAAEQLREAQANYAEKRLAVISEVRRQIERVRTARARLELQQKIYKMTAETRDLVRNQYIAGRASLTRLNEAQSDLVRADGNLAAQQIRYRQSLEDLAAITGRDLARYSGEGK